MKYTIEMASDGMIYKPRFVKIGLGIQVILRLKSKPRKILA
jgi:hypothetical protein